jgi:curved DNA-binding protein CbpA
MVKCPSCGSDNRESAKFCAKCRALLVAFVDFYALLNLDPAAAPDQVHDMLNQAARAQPPLLPPDQLGAALDALSDPQRRAEYDRQRLIHLAEQRFKRADLGSNDYYQRLGVSRFARRKEIQAAFEQIKSLVAAGRIKRGGLIRMEEAYACVSDPARRRAYDQTLDAAAGPDDVPVPYEFNYYDYLGLERTATEIQIRKADEAVRGPLTLKAKLGDETAEATLRQLNQIIQTLTDANKRAAYDADALHDVFRFQTPGRLSPTTRAARFAVIESIVYGAAADGLAAFGGPWPDEQL